VPTDTGLYGLPDPGPHMLELDEGRTIVSDRDYTLKRTLNCS
jgi:hypothetical protein